MSVFGPILLLMFSQFTSPFMGIDFLQSNVSQTKQLAYEQISLEKRYPNPYVNSVFKDNILLNISYMAQKVTKKQDINWSEIEKPISYKFILLPNETFAFHNDVLEKYKKSVVKTTNANFNFNDGFKSDGYLMGDGVCHLASLMYWAAKNAGLNAYAPTNHDFAVIPEIDKQYGVSIYKMPNQANANAMQNLYITNSKTNPVSFEFNYENNKLTLAILEVLNPAL